jgi:hypothetical protein
MKKNWKTTLIGCALIAWGLYAWGFKGADGITAVSIVTMGLGLVFAKDYNVTGR